MTGSNPPLAHNSGKEPPSEGISADASASQGGTLPSRESLLAELERKKAIAKSIALDAALEVKLGAEGEGSFCAYGAKSNGMRKGAFARMSAADRVITIDPQHLLDPAGDFIIAHEGMHARISFSALAPKIQSALVASGFQDPEQVYRQVGVQTTLNFLEDCAGNSWLFNNYPGFRESGKILYDKALLQENPTMGNPEVDAIAHQLGFFPRYAQFGSEVMKKWWSSSYSTKLDPDVEKALKTCEGFVKEYVEAVPDGRLTDLEQRQVEWVKRYIIGTEKIFPHVSKLLEQDVQQAAQQKLSDLLQQNGQQQSPHKGQQDSRQDHGDPQEQPGQQGQQGGCENSCGGSGGSGSRSRSGAGGGSKSGASSNAGTEGASASGSSQGHSAPPINGPLNRQLQEELQRQAAAHQEELRKKLNEALDDLQGQSGSGAADVSSDTSNNSSGAPTEEQLREKIERLRGEMQRDAGSSKEAKEELERAEKMLDTLKEFNEGIKNQSAPIGELPQYLREAIEEAFEQLSPEQREELETAARDLLTQLEDKLRESMDAELVRDKPQTHGERKQAAENEERAAAQMEQLHADIKRMEANRQAQLDEWNRIREPIARQINNMYAKLERVLRPSVPEWESGFASGGRPNPFIAMQAQADPTLKLKQWERKVLPSEKSFRFSLLVDVSGSMMNSKLYESAMTCAVLMSETLHRLKVPFEIATFWTRSKVVKPFDLSPSKEQKNQIIKGLFPVDGSTCDFDAIRKRTDGLLVYQEDYRFIAVITDGGSDDPWKLRAELDRAHAGNIHVIGLGIGAQTGDVDRHYLLGRGRLTMDDKDKQNGLTPYFGRLLEKLISNPDGVIREARRQKGV